MISAELARPGDRVTMNMDKEARAWGRKGAANGTLGTVVGRERVVLFEGRVGVGRHFREPGIYAKDGSLLVLWDGNIKAEAVSDYDLEPLDKAAFDERRKTVWFASTIECTVQRRDAFDNLVRLSDLPDTPFWEGDIVRHVEEEEEGLLRRVIGIEYTWKDDRPDKELAYRVEWVNAETREAANRGYTYTGQSRLELVERGNVWKEAHGEPLVFASLLEEANYYDNTGRASEVKNAATDNYRWTQQEALAAIKRGDGDCLSLSSLFGMEPTPRVRRFDNRDLGERLRTATLEGFDYV